MSNSFDQIQRLLEEKIVAASSVPVEDTAVTVQRHRDFYYKNLKAIDKIVRKDTVASQAGRLSFSRCEGHRTFDDRHDWLPLLRSSTDCEIALEAIQLPESTGSTNLRDLIKSKCRGFGMSFDESTDTAPCTLLEFGISGKPDERDTLCTAPMQAYVVPTYDNNQDDVQRVLVLAIPLNGASGVRMDNMRLSPHHSMSCKNRQGTNHIDSAIKITEVPEPAAEDMEKKAPGLLTQDHNSCVITVIEYDVLESDPRDPAIKKSVTTTVQQSTGGNRQNEGNPAHAVMGPGSSLEDDASTIYEKGWHVATRIQVYIVRSRVVNTKGEALTNEGVEQLLGQMKQDVMELDEQFASCKTMSFQGLFAFVNEHIASYRLDCRKVPLIEEALLRLAGSEEWPNPCRLKPCDREHMVLEGHFTHYGASRIVEETRKMFGVDFCQLDENGHIRYALKALPKMLPILVNDMKKSLSGERASLALQKYSAHQASLHSEFMGKVDRMMTAKGLSIYKTPAMELVLLAMAGVRLLPEYVRLSPGNTFVESLLDMHLHIDVAPELAGEIADKFTARFPEFPESVRLLHTGEEGQEFCNISFQGELLCNNLFLAAFRETLNQLAENEPLLIESLRMASGSPGKPTMQHAETLHQLATAHRNGHSSEQALADSLVSLAHTSTNHSATLSERRLAGAKAREALTLFSKSLSADDRAAFRQGEKREIKTAIAELSRG